MIRALLFVVGLFVAGSAFAEATSFWSASHKGGEFPSSDAACLANRPVVDSTVVYSLLRADLSENNIAYCFFDISYSDSPSSNQSNVQVGYAARYWRCDSGEVVVNPSSDCPAPSPCESKQGQNGSQTFAVPSGGSATTSGQTFCIDSCGADVVFVSPVAHTCAFSETGAGTCSPVQTFQYVFNGGGCNGSESPTPSGDTPQPANKPPCQAGQGVLTSESGTVACVPEGVPQASKPDVKKEVEEQIYPDGSKKRTETTKTSDPKTGASSTSSSTTNTAGPSGGTQSGTPGTTTSTKTATTSGSNGTGDGDGDGGGICDEKPDMLACKVHSFTGSCDAEPACEGDAALCATAKAAWMLKCAYQADATTALVNKDAPGGTADQVAAGQAALNSDRSKDVDISAKFTEYNRNWLNFSSSCPAGVQEFQVASARIVLDFGFLCSIGAFVRLLVHIVAYMAVARLFATKLF